MGVKTWPRLQRAFLLSIVDKPQDQMLDFCNGLTPQFVLQAMCVCACVWRGGGSTAKGPVSTRDSGCKLVAWAGEWGKGGDRGLIRGPRCTVKYLIQRGFFPQAGSTAARCGGLRCGLRWQGGRDSNGRTLGSSEAGAPWLLTEQSQHCIGRLGVNKSSFPVAW